MVKFARSIVWFLVTAVLGAINYGHKILGWLGIGGAPDDWKVLSGWLVDVWSATGLPPMTRELAVDMALAVAGCMLLWSLFGPAIKRKVVDATGFKKILSIDFDDDCNIDGAASPNKRFHVFLPQGAEQKTISEIQFIVGITNHSAKTVRQVRLVAKTINMPDRNIDVECLRLGSTSRDITPGDDAKFLLCHRYDYGVENIDSWFTGSMDYSELSRRADAFKTIGAIMMGNRNTETLLKNNGYRVTLVAYADDVKPVSKTIIINAKDRLSVYNEGALPNFSRPKSSASWFRRLRGIEPRKPQ